MLIKNLIITYSSAKQIFNGRLSSLVFLEKGRDEKRDESRKRGQRDRQRGRQIDGRERQKWSQQTIRNRKQTHTHTYTHTHTHIYTHREKDRPNERKRGRTYHMSKVGMTSNRSSYIGYPKLNLETIKIWPIY